MAIPSRQIGWSTQSNLLWEISKQLERLTCVMAGGCNTTTTTTTLPITNYNVAGCERMEEYHVISYTGEGVLPEGTIVNNDTPECWYIIDQTIEPADVGTITYVWPTLGDCTPCIDSHTTTTTTTTSTPLIQQNSAYIPCEPCVTPCAPSIVIIYTEQACIDNITIGCHMYSDEVGTSNAPEGYYEGWNGVGYFYIDANGLVLNIDTCPQPEDNLINTRDTFVNCGIINDCPGVSCTDPFSYFDVWMLQSCTTSWPSIGCEVWLDKEKTIPFPNGGYSDGGGNGCIVITDGIVTAIP